MPGVQIQPSKFQQPLNSLLTLPRDSSKFADTLERLNQVFQENCGVSKSILLLFDFFYPEKSYYSSQDTEITPNLLSLCHQLVEENLFSLHKGKVVTWTRKEDEAPLTLPLPSLAPQTFPINSILMMPLSYRGIYLGEWCLLSQQPEKLWTPQEMTLMRHFTNQSALTIYQTQKLDYQIWQQDIIRRINQQINSRLNPESIIRDLLAIIGESFQFEQVLVLTFQGNQFRVNQEWRSHSQVPSGMGKNILLEDFRALYEGQFPSLNQPSNGGINWLDSPLVKGEFLNLENRTIQTGMLVSVPIKVQEKFFGVLLLQTTKLGFKLSPEVLETFVEVSEHIAIALYHLQNQSDWITEQNEKLQAEKEQLEAAKQKTSEFLDHTIHELRSPLTGILSFSKILQEQVYGELNPKQNQYVDVIVSSGEHMLSLVNDFLDLSKIEAHREEVIVETIAVEDVCLASLAIVEARAQESGLELKLELGDNVDFCKADQRRVKQILVNLLSNAIKFTEKGSVTLRVQRHEKDLEFSVIDTGIGISEEDQKQLFQPFKQIKNHLTRKHKGTGLGLALSRRLAQLHGGDIRLVSEEGQGSCFTLYLPIF